MMDSPEPARDLWPTNSHPTRPAINPMNPANLVAFKSIRVTTRARLLMLPIGENVNS
jgi:hypothetical protein